MSRAFHPPNTLSKDDRKIIADVRREIWTNGFIGLGIGSATGIVSHAMASYGNRIGIWKLPLSNNTRFASIMASGAIGSFLMATVAGTNEVHMMHDIFNRGSRQSLDQEYETAIQQIITKQQQQQQQSQQQQNNEQIVEPLSYDNDTINSSSLERIQRERNRIYRKATLKRTMDNQHGLSDSHGGTWSHDDNTNNDDITQFRKE